MPNTISLSRKHYARLRQYWQVGRLGLMSVGDGCALDLAAAGYLEVCPSEGGLKLKITQAGIEELQAESEREKVRRKPHHVMAERVALWLRDNGRVTWTNIEFKVDIDANRRQCFRPDVYSLMSTLDPARINPAVHEIKVSRADFLSDRANPDKRGGYSRIAEVLYYVAPVGIIEVNEVPDECGFIVEKDLGVFEVLKRPKKKPAPLDARVFMNLVLKPHSEAAAKAD